MIRGTDNRERACWAPARWARHRRGRTMGAILLALIAAGPGALPAVGQQGTGISVPALPELSQPSEAQTPSPGREAAQPGQPGADSLGRPQSDGVRYRLLERYSPEASPTDGRVGAYRVAFWESSQTMVEVPQGAPERTETSILVKTTERPAAFGGIDQSTVLGLVRRYDSVQLKPDPRKLPSDPAMLAGRTVWLEQNRRGFPLVLTMTEIERPLLEEEFRFAAFQNIFMPDLVDLLPEVSTLVGGTWEIPGAGAKALLGSEVFGGRLTGKLVRIEPTATAGRARAILSVSGRVQLQQTVGAVNAELEFEYAAPEEEPLPGTLVSAKGAIMRLGMSIREISRVAREGRSANASRTRQIVLERRLAAPGEEVLDIPAPIPMKTVQNSWVRSIGQDGLFRFDHPQDYLRGAMDPGQQGIHLMRDQPGGPDDLTIEMIASDRSTEDKMVQTITAGWGTVGISARKGPAEWLPEADWPGMRVFRAEFSLVANIPPAVGQPLQKAHQEAYQIRFQRDMTAYIKATTAAPDPAEFREEIEEIIRTISLTPGPQPAPTPAP